MDVAVDKIQTPLCKNIRKTLCFLRNKIFLLKEYATEFSKHMTNTPDNVKCSRISGKTIERMYLEVFFHSLVTKIIPMVG